MGIWVSGTDSGIASLPLPLLLLLLRKASGSSDEHDHYPGGHGVSPAYVGLSVMEDREQGVKQTGLQLKNVHLFLVLMS